MDTKIQNILDIIDNALSMEGYEILDGKDGQLVIVGEEKEGYDFNVTVTSTPK